MVKNKEKVIQAQEFVSYQLDNVKIIWHCKYLEYLQHSVALTRPSTISEIKNQLH